jgi:hypothetical protein
MRPIRYRHFYDIPRSFLVTADDITYLFDCPFNESGDEYPEHFSVYRVGTPLEDDPEAIAWDDLQEGGEYLGTVSTSSVLFDESRRRSVDETILNSLSRG